MRTSRIRQDIQQYLADRSEEKTFLRSEFNTLAKSRSGVDKALRSLVTEGILVRLGYGIVTRGRYVARYQKVGITAPLDSLVREALVKLGAEPKSNSALIAYNSGQSTQIPTWMAFEVNKKIKRNIGFGQRWVNYEQNGKWYPTSRSR